MIAALDANGLGSAPALHRIGTGILAIVIGLVVGLAGFFLGVGAGLCDRGECPSETATSISQAMAIGGGVLVVGGVVWRFLPRRR